MKRAAVRLARLMAAAMAVAAQASAASAAVAPPDPACEARAKFAAAQQAADQAQLRSITSQVDRGGFAAIQAQSPALQALLDHAPAHRPDKTCDGSDIVYVSSTEEALTAMLMAAGRPHGETGRTVAMSTGPYPTAALLLGSLDVETGRYEQALVYLRRGLELAPTEPQLTTEAANTLSHLGRSQEALAIVDRTLSGDPALPPEQRARLLRSKGYSLGELKRYDEAESAYRESLKLQPGHVGAQNELIYLARMKAGAAPTTSLLITSDKAATTSADDVLAARRRQGR